MRALRAIRGEPHERSDRKLPHARQALVHDVGGAVELANRDPVGVVATVRIRLTGAGAVSADDVDA